MRGLLLLSCVWLASAGTLPEARDEVTFDGKQYRRELLAVARLADNFSYQNSTNTLFFSYVSPTNQTEHHFIGVAYLNLDTKEFTDIPSVPDGFATGIDPATGDIYLGGNNGVQKFNPLTKVAEPYTAEGTNIYFLSFDKKLYYTTFPSYELYSYDGEKTQHFPNITMKAFQGDEEEYYFANNTGLFRVLNLKLDQADKFADAEENDFTILAKDNNKKIFVVRIEGGVLVPNVKDKKLENVYTEKVFGLAFDKDNNIIYSDLDNIYKLTLIQET